MLEGKAIAIWSHRGNIGKTITCIHLAQRLSELHGKTILVDLDFKNPRVADYLGITDMSHNIDNLYSYVAGSNLTKDIIDINIDVVGNLHVLKGTANIFQSDHVNVDHVTPIIAYLKTIYDYVVIDSCNLVKNIGTYTALTQADIIFSLLSKDIVSTMSFHEQKPVVFGNFNSDKFRFVLNMDSDKVYMQSSEIETALEIKISNSLPLFEISNMNDINKGQIIGMLNKKENTSYTKALDKLIEMNISKGVNYSLNAGKKLRKSYTDKVIDKILRRK